jgi:hypothetical protein
MLVSLSHSFASWMKMTRRRNKQKKNAQKATTTTGGGARGWKGALQWSKNSASQGQGINRSYRPWKSCGTGGGSNSSNNSNNVVLSDVTNQSGNNHNFIPAGAASAAEQRGARQQQEHKPTQQPPTNNRQYQQQLNNRKHHSSHAAHGDENSAPPLVLESTENPKNVTAGHSNTVVLHCPMTPFTAACFEHCGGLMDVSLASGAMRFIDGRLDSLGATAGFTLHKKIREVPNSVTCNVLLGLNHVRNQLIHGTDKNGQPIQEFTQCWDVAKRQRLSRSTFMTMYDVAMQDLLSMRPFSTRAEF